MALVSKFRLVFNKYVNSISIDKSGSVPVCKLVPTNLQVQQLQTNAISYLEFRGFPYIKNATLFFIVV